ncbi:MAG: ribosome small subunit-dependent GTPase A [Clostridia bacterium]|nr:ribosome small subunit-dependent GTPase A [Clostridia bacterium]
MNTGTIVKGIGGFYYVDTGEEIVECKARGHFRNKNMSPCVGDKVDITITGEGKGSLDTIHQRSNVFIRPPVANIDAMIIVASVQNPAPDLAFIDKMLIIAQNSNVDVKICFNKFDLDNGSVNELVQMYRNAGYTAFTTSTVEDIGIDLIRKSLSGRITAFSGFSGVGKSSLLNAVLKQQVMQTGDVSERLKRGKHTTRHVELISYNNGYIVDTPGFSMLDFPKEITKDELKDYFPEFLNYESQCRFRGCNHMGNTKVCAVCDAVQKGEISETRFNNYKSFYDILSQRKEWQK